MGATFQFKVVVAGPFAAGKTTLIDAISDVPVVGTEAPTSGSEAGVKPTTTVGMEYGTYRVPGDGLPIDLFLYGVPGQSRFRFMWDIVAEGMDGLILLVDASRPDTWDEAATVARTFLADVDHPLVIAVNRFDGDLDRWSALCAAVGTGDAPVVVVDVFDPRSVREVLVELLLLLLERLPEQEVVR